MPTLTPIPIPQPKLYSLLKALDPARALKGRLKPLDGAKLPIAAKRSFESTLTAAKKAKSPKEFSALLKSGMAMDSVQENGWGPITELTVQYTKEGYTIVTVRYENGQHGLVTAFPTT